MIKGYNFGRFAGANLLAALIAFAPAAFAAETAGSSSTSSESSMNSFMKNFYADYFTFYHGPTINDLSSTNSVDNHGNSNPKSVSGLDSEITTAYMINRERGIGIGPDIPFLAMPTGGGQLLLGDVGIKAMAQKTIATENFRLYTNLYVQAPTSASSQARNMKYAIKTAPYLWYDIPDSRFRLGAWLELKDYAGVTSGKMIKAYAAPYVTYRLHEKFLISLEYEMESDHNVDNDPWQFIAYQNDIQPGFIWKINKTTMINPYLQIFPTSKLATSNTAVGFAFYTLLL